MCEILGLLSLKALEKFFETKLLVLCGGEFF